MAKPVLNARYRERRHTVAVLDPTRTRTAWFGRPALRCEPERRGGGARDDALARPRGRRRRPARRGREDARAVLSRWTVEELERRSGIAAARASAVVEALRAGPSSGVLARQRVRRHRAARPRGRARRARSPRPSARASSPCSRARTRPGSAPPSTPRAYPGRRGHTTPELLEAAVTGDVKALLVFGADPVAAFPGTIAAQAMRSACLHRGDGRPARARHRRRPTSCCPPRSSARRPARSTARSARARPSRRRWRPRAGPARTWRSSRPLGAAVPALAGPAEAARRHPAGRPRRRGPQRSSPSSTSSCAPRGARRRPGARHAPAPRGVVGDQRRRGLAHRPALVGALRLPGAAARPLDGARGRARRAGRRPRAGAQQLGRSRSSGCGSTRACPRAS